MTILSIFLGKFYKDIILVVIIIMFIITAINCFVSSLCKRAEWTSIKLLYLLSLLFIRVSLSSV